MEDLSQYFNYRSVHLPTLPVFIFVSPNFFLSFSLSLAMQRNSVILYKLNIYLFVYNPWYMLCKGLSLTLVSDSFTCYLTRQRHNFVVNQRRE